MNIKEKAVRGVLWSIIQGWGSQAISLLIFAALARLLTPDTFGLIALANVFIAFLQVFLDQGFSHALIQREDLEPEHLDTAFWTNIIIGGFLTLINFAIAGWIAVSFHKPELTPILQWLSLLHIIAALSRVQQAILERQFAYKSLAIRTLIATSIGGLIGIILAFQGYGIFSLISQALASEILGTIILWGASDWRPKFRFSFIHFRHLVSFGSSIIGLNLLTFLNTRSDDLLIGYYLGAVALGYYSVAYRIFILLTQSLIRTIKQVAFPTFSRLQKDPEQFRNTFYKATQLTSFIAFPVFVVTAILAPELIRIMFGEQWLASAPVLQVLAIAGTLKAISNFKSSVFMALGKPSWNLYLNFFGVTLNLIGFAIAVRWGIVAVAWAYLLRSIILFPIYHWIVSLLIKDSLSQYLRQFVIPLLCTLIMGLALWGIKQVLNGTFNSVVILIIYLIFALLSYGIAVKLLAPKFELWTIISGVLPAKFKTKKSLD